MFGVVVFGSCLVIKELKKFAVGVIFSMYIAVKEARYGEECLWAYIKEIFVSMVYIKAS